MRLSIRPNDSGYPYFLNATSRLQRATVLFNDVHQTLVVTADSEAGMLVRVKCDAAGKPIWDCDRSCFEEEVVHGKVEIEFNEMVCL